MQGSTAILDLLGGIGQLVIVLVLAIVLYKIGKFIDSLSEMIKKE